MSDRRDVQFTYNPHNKATILDCNFIVDSANGNGLGLRSLKRSGRISSAYMNSAYTATSAVNNSVTITSLSPVTSNLQVGWGVSGTGIPVGARIASIVSSTSITITSATTGGSGTPTLTFWAHPGANVPAGYIIVNLQDNYNRYLYGSAGFGSPISGSAIDVAGTGVTINDVYVIVVVGTTTAAQWQSIGLPAYITPAVGVSFVATKTGTATGTGYVETTLPSGVFSVEVIGDPNQMNSNGANVLGVGQGMQIISACYNNNGSTGTIPAIVAPTDQSVVGMLFYMNNSSEGV